jgi:hypothetical protein
MPMVTIIYPRTINWFYRHQADLLQAEFVHHGFRARRVPSDDIATLDRRTGIAIILSYWECATDAQWLGLDDQFHEVVRTFDRRILLNYDSLFTQYFRRHFTFMPGQLTEIIDVCVASQTHLKSINGIPYRRIPEAFCAAELLAIEPWSEGRPLPWVMLGHTNAARAALVAACIDRIHPGGLVFMPPIRPYTSEAALERRAVHRVLQLADLYVWGSHHAVPYHEGLRALHAVAAGAIPCKIDPLHYARFSAIPWVYPNLVELKAACTRVGLAELYSSARTYLYSNGTMGALLVEALGLPRHAAAVPSAHSRAASSSATTRSAIPTS